LIVDNYKKSYNFIFIIYCSFLLAKKRTSSEAAKEKTANHLACGYPVLLKITEPKHPEGIKASCQ